MTGRYRAMVCRRLGPPEVLEEAWLARRGLQPGEVRVAIRAAGINFPDLLQVAGEYQHKPSMPFVPGFEAAGEIVETAPDVSSWRTGDPVILRLRGGGYAEEAIATASTLLPKPAGWSYEEAAAFPVAAATAWTALVQRGRLRASEILLVLGAGGGTGLAAVSLGVTLGARVIAVASSAEKRAAAQTAGAASCLDPASPDWWRGVTADAVFDPVGGVLFEQAFRALAPGGRWLVVGFAGGTPPRPAANRLLLREAELIGIRAGEQGRRDPSAGMLQDAALRDWLVSGQGRPRLDVVYRLGEAGTALRRLSERQVTGKLVLRIG
ncbi:NADPH:quinone oxidoreductase family protein [Ferrovibrio sp.]|uniref:NADPH:quinone oxidoreductase family protein n=1 Tax=Ferrovibrio sp. TaxID=1917215 RepID=UPI0026195B4A|nr:NADPH:quinone oxidoreductase family protein [Ferrovibrio sp.]